MIAFALSFALAAAPIAATLRDAAHAYESRDYGAAERGYAAALASGAESADLEYDLGTAAAQAGDLGQAVLHLERALSLAPWDGDVRQNLERLRERRLDKVVGEELGDGPLQRLLRGLPVAPLGWSFALLWLTGVALFWRRRRGLGLASGALALAALALSLGARATRAEPYAVVTAPVAEVHTGPDRSLRATFELHEGTKVRLERTEAGLAQVRLANGLEGWIEAKSAERI